MIRQCYFCRRLKSSDGIWIEAAAGNLLDQSKTLCPECTEFANRERERQYAIADAKRERFKGLLTGGQK
jgi:hypothetical protein